MATTETENTELVRDYLRAFNEQDRDAMAGYLAEDVVEHGIHEKLHGHGEVFAFLQRHFEAFPDYSGTTDAVVTEGDTVCVRYTAAGTHSGEYRDVEPTGHTVEWSGMAMYRVEDGEIAEIWLEEDRLGLLEQLEMVDPPAHLRI